jgi:phenylalanyl-tRNA synthetase alpha subunit
MKGKGLAKKDHQSFKDINFIKCKILTDIYIDSVFKQSGTRILKKIRLAYQTFTFATPSLEGSSRHNKERRTTEREEVEVMAYGRVRDVKQNTTTSKRGSLLYLLLNKYILIMAAFWRMMVS